MRGYNLSRVHPESQPDLFPVGSRKKPSRAGIKAVRPYWTENKAKLIERYLYQFLMVTKHGLYIDGFAGPQEEHHSTENWSARLVLSLRPQWLRKFVLIEQNADQVERIKAMTRGLPRTPLGKKMRNIAIHHGDVNVVLPKYLSDNPIRRTMATFCLLDQRTFECHWATVQTVAQHKKAGHKIEIFYFLANSWLHRAFATTKDEARKEAWWGRSDWKEAESLNGWTRALQMTDRFHSELGYKFARPYPIYERKGGTRIMYFMIHATDHTAAPDLMRRSYDTTVEPLATPEQVAMFLRQEHAERQ